MARPQHVDQGGDVRRREGQFTRFRDDLLRESGNAASLLRARDRVLACRDVQQDAILAGMLRSFAEERIAAVRRAHSQAAAPHMPTSAVSFSQPAAPAAREPTPADIILGNLHQLERQFDDYLAHYLEPEARGIVARIVELSVQAPGIIPEGRIPELQQRLNAFTKKRAELAESIRRLADEAVSAARDGDEPGVEVRLQRLSSVHALHPFAFNDQDFEVVRRQIREAGEAQQRRDAIQELLARERGVNDELKKLAAIIHHFHAVARTIPLDKAEFQKAGTAYHLAVAEVKAHDADWLAVLILESLDLLAGAATPKAEAHIDAFVAAVRSALVRLRREIGEIENELHPRPDSPATKSARP